MVGVHAVFTPHQLSIAHVGIWQAHCAYECIYPSCLLLYVNTLYGMLTPLLNVNTFMECHHLYGMSTPLFQEEDQSVRMNEQRTGDGAQRVLQLE